VAEDQEPVATADDEESVEPVAAADEPDDEESFDEQDDEQSFEQDDEQGFELVAAADEEPVAPAAGSGSTEEYDVLAAPADPDDDEPRVAFDGWSGPDDSEAKPSRRGRIAILAIIAAGILILAIGLVQLLGDDGGSSSPQRSSRPAAQVPAAPAASAAKPAPSRTELRTRARIRAMGDRDLSPGTLGDDVKALQRLLGVPATGNFGDQTAFAVGQFQARHGLPSTGVADAATKRKLARRPHPPKVAPTPPAASTTPPPATGETTTPPATGTTAPPAGTGTTPPAGTGTAPAPSPPGQ
jgi:hypothetical protein